MFFSIYYNKDGNYMKWEDEAQEIWNMWKLCSYNATFDMFISYCLDIIYN